MLVARNVCSPIVSEEKSSASGVPKWGTCITAESSTFLSLGQFAMRCWKKLLLKSTIGFPIQAGQRFTFTARMASSTSGGSCGYRISPMH